MAAVMRRSFAVTKNFARNLDNMAGRVRTRKSATDMKRLQAFLAKSNATGSLKQKVNKQAASDEEFSSFLKTYREKNPECATLLDFSRFFDENNQLKDNIRFRQDEVDMLKEFQKRAQERKEEYQKQQQELGPFDKNIMDVNNPALAFNPVNYTFRSKFAYMIMARGGTTNVTRMGRINSFRVLMFAGNSDGVVAYAKGKGKDSEAAMTHAMKLLKKNMVGLDMEENNTFPLEINTHFSRYFLKIEPVKSFISWGNPLMSTMIQLCGIQNVRWNDWRRNPTPYNMVQCFVKAVCTSKSIPTLAEGYGVRPFQLGLTKGTSNFSSAYRKFVKLNRLIADTRLRRRSMHGSSRKKKEPSLHESSDDEQSTMGRWTREEHNKFVDGLRKYGKNWKLIEDYVNTRSGSQIRSHAQKFFSRLEKQCNITKNDVFKYLDKLSNDLLEFNSENEMLRKRKIWEVIKASNMDDFDCAAVEEKLEKFTKAMEVAMAGTQAIPDPILRDTQYMVWREVVKGVADLARDFNHELERDTSFRSNCYKKFIHGVNVRLLGIESDQGVGGGSTSQEHPLTSVMAPPLPTFGRMHSNSEDNICVDFNKFNKPRLTDFIQMAPNQPEDADKTEVRRARLPSFKIHDESEENLQKMKQFKEENQHSDGKRNRTSSLEL